MEDRSVIHIRVWALLDVLVYTLLTASIFFLLFSGPVRKLREETRSERRKSYATLNVKVEPLLLRKRFVESKVDTDWEDWSRRVRLPTISICRINNLVVNSTNLYFINATYGIKRDIKKYLRSINIYGTADVG